MIGQINLLKQIDKLIDENNFPRFSIITGQKGQGKKTLAKEIANKLNCPIINILPKIDDIRQMIELAYKQTEPIIYQITDADNMSLNAKNSLLKVIEEPPQQAYFIMTLNDINNTLPTIKSRCQEFKMEKYFPEELEKFIDVELNEIDKEILLSICQNKYQIDLMLKYGVQEFYEFVEKVIYNIHKVQSANAFKLEEKLDIKCDGNGYDLNLFFQTVEEIYLYEMKQNYLIDNFYKFADSITITSRYQQKLNINGINRDMLITQWIIDIRKIWRD